MSDLILGAEVGQILTNDGYIINVLFCNPYQVKKDMNMMG